MSSYFLKSCCVLLCLTLAACGEEKTYTAITKSVLTVTPEPANKNASRTLSGVLQPADLSVVSFELPGVVTSVTVNLGDRFEQGQVLATLENTLFELAVKQRKGQLAETKARAEEAKLDFQRQQEIVKNGGVSKASVDAAQARFQSLIEQVNVAQTQVELAMEDLADTSLKAPFAGVVSQRHVEPSQQVSAGTSILSVQGIDAFEVLVMVPEAMISQLQTGDPAQVNMFAQNNAQTLNATIFERGSQAQTANAFPVTLTLDANQNTASLHSGMSAEVTFKLPTSRDYRTSLAAPLSSVAAGDNNSHFVMVLQATDSNQFKLKKVPVNVIDFTPDHVIFTAQDKVPSIVSTGVDFLRDGQMVSVAKGYPRTINE